MTSPERSLGRQLARIEKAQRDKGSTSQLGASSIIDEGAIREWDLDGTLKQVIGRQPDGTNTTVQMNGPVPPNPNMPSVETLPGSARVSWDGTWVGGAVAPLDLARIDVHIVPEDNFEPLSLPPRASIVSQGWGGVTLPLLPGNYYAVLIAWTTSGKWAMSDYPADLFAVPPVVDLSELEDALEELQTDLAAAQTEIDDILPITETKISDGAITTPKIASEAITAAKIMAGTITATQIAAGTITASKIQSGTITALQIAAGTITANEILAGTITTAELSANAIDGMVITGATLQTDAAVDEGVKINDTDGFVSYMPAGSAIASWSQYGSPAVDTAMDSTGRFYAMSNRGPEARSYVTRYDSDGSISLTIDLGVNFLGCGVWVDSAGKIFAMGSTLIRRYSSGGALELETPHLVTGGQLERLVGDASGYMFTMSRNADTVARMSNSTYQMINSWTTTDEPYDIEYEPITNTIRVLTFESTPYPIAGTGKVRAWTTSGSTSGTPWSVFGEYGSLTSERPSGGLWVSTSNGGPESGSPQEAYLRKYSSSGVILEEYDTDNSWGTLLESHPDGTFLVSTTSSRRVTVISRDKERGVLIESDTGTLNSVGGRITGVVNTDTLTTRLITSPDGRPVSIEWVADPDGADDAANKRYVDNLSAWGSITRTAVISLTNAAETPIVYTVPNRDTAVVSGGVEATTSGLIVPSDGMYAITMIASFAAATVAGSRIPVLKVNGVTRESFSIPLTAGTSGYPIITMQPLAANDVVSYSLYQSSGANINSHNQAYPGLKVVKVGF